MKKPSLIITIIIAISCIMNASNIPQGFSAGDKHISLTPIEDTKKELSIVGKYSLKEAVRCVTTEKDAERTTTQQEQFQPDYISPCYVTDCNDSLYICPQLIVRFFDSAQLSDLLSSFPQLSLSYQVVDAFVLDCDVASSDILLKLVETINSLDGVDWCEPNILHKIKFHNPLYPQQYYLKNTGQSGGVAGYDINAESAWNVIHGSNAITVAVLDGGVDLNHEDLDGCIVQGYTIAVPTSYGAPVTDTAEIYYHGTCCAGIIGAIDNTVGIKGVAHGVNIMSINLAPWGVYADDGSIASAIQYAAQHADVLSCSWGSVTLNVIATAIQYARTQGRGGKGCPVVFSAGNDRNVKPNGDIENNDIIFPANIDGVIAVGAIDASGNPCMYSQRGANLDVVALSSASKLVGQGDIVSTDLMETPGYTTGNYYYQFTGTSAACPQVAGVAALMLTMNPSLTEAQLQARLKSSAQNLGTTVPNDSLGYGLVDAYAAVMAAKPNYSIGGPIFVTDSATYYVNALPEGTTVVWEYYGTMQMTQNDPLPNQCKIKRVAGSTPNSMLIAKVYNGNVKIAQITRNLNYTFSGTYRQESCNFHGVSHPAINNKTLSSGGVYFVHQGCRVHLQSELFRIVTPQHSGITPDFWGLAPAIGEVQFELPYMSGGSPFQIYINGNLSNNDFHFTFFPVSNNGNVSQSALVVEPTNNGFVIRIADSDEDNANRGLIFLNSANSVVLSELTEWQLDVYATEPMAKTFSAHVVGDRFELNTTSWPQGIYVITVHFDGETYSQKIIVE